MKATFTNLRRTALYFCIATLAIACKDDVDTQPTLRALIDVAKLTDTVSYSAGNKLFVDANGISTVSVSGGNVRLKMLAAINTYNGLALKNGQVLDANTLKNLYTNTNNPFTTVYHPDFAGLNASGVQLRNVTASSFSATAAEVVRAKIEAGFTDMATISTSVNAIASKGQAGYVLNGTTKYLLDAKGIETAQIIQKSLIGAFQLDYISNILLGKGLDADNTTLVSGKNYTQLEHNWDEAYGVLTLNPIFLKDATDAAKSATAAESFLGSYVWEYNKAGYAKVHSAFLKGRAAVVNNNAAEYKVQASFIKSQFELAIAKAALGYLDKWKTSGTNDGARAHAIAEGLGFIYSLRFTAGADVKFSDDILNGLVSSSTGFWDLTPVKINTASDAIKVKFSL